MMEGGREGGREERNKIFEMPNIGQVRIPAFTHIHKTK
jgi:hypothetical protein